jgi:hypothetical protein
MMTLEAWVKSDIKAGLARNGIPYFMPVQTGFGRRGVDFYATLPPNGRALLIEAKRPDGKGRLTAAQRKVLEENRRAGGISVVARSWKDVSESIYGAS